MKNIDVKKLKIMFTTSNTSLSVFIKEITCNVCV